ncbi:hypothetical protein K474DRAFT_422827 [Panus rudis PR-1116 ss-1]|nr:hypothetical protein K474DRAFT_422827 [Panus rudis PR-1116 ss-1]
MSESGMTIFPQEIYDQIILQCSILDCGDHYEDWIIPLPPREQLLLREQTLNACSLTCRSWARYSQQHLFRTIWVELDKKHKNVTEWKITSLAETLRSNPDRGRLVQILRVDCESAPTDPTWVFMALIRRVPNLSALVISSSLLLKIDLHPCFYRVLGQYQSIRQLRLHNVDDPNVIIRTLAVLRSITHFCVNLNKDWINLDVTKLARLPRHVSVLDSLILDYGFVTNLPQDLQDVLTGLNTTLTRGNISLTSTRFLVVQTLLPPSANLIMRAGPSLRELVILGDHELLPTDAAFDTCQDFVVYTIRPHIHMSLRALFAFYLQ